ncbi:UDP-3-O-(3-hydroxymyristoyl)glucosamine N-acyltransferase [Thalassotalea agariperforans]
MSLSFTLKEIAEKIGATVEGDENCLISSLATLASAERGQVAFLANKKYKKQLSTTLASAVILAADCQADFSGNKLVMDNPYLGFALTAQLLDTTPNPADNIHPSAVIADDAILGKGVCIGANSVVESGVELADNVVIGANCFIGKSVKVAENTKCWANVTIYHNVEIGHDCLIQAGSVIGADGFGYANHQGQWLKIPQLGTVIIGNKVEIGASTTIDRGALDNTEIHDGVILDNQIQIGHNAVVGQNSCIAACTAVAGSTTIGANCTIGGCVAIAGHLTIADKVMITGNTMVIKSITSAGVYSSGMPAMTNRDWLKNNVRINKLDKLTEQVKALTVQLDNLKAEKE